MLPIKAWRIYYADGSAYDSTMGPWAEAPPFGVECVVWYHEPPYKTLYGGEPGNDVYIYKGEEEYEGLKMGMWMDEVGLYRIHKLANASTMPKPAQ
jgi:hypothetical protein